jgi:ATP-dependent RNA helicase RhlE
MQMQIPLSEFPDNVEISKELLEEERTKIKEHYNPLKRRQDEDAPGPAFTEKSEKNKKENRGGSYKFKIAKKYKKPKTRGDKTYNKKKRGK